MRNDKLKWLLLKHGATRDGWCDWCMHKAPCDVKIVVEEMQKMKSEICNVLSLGHPDAAELRDAIIKAIECE